MQLIICNPPTVRGQRQATTEMLFSSVMGSLKATALTMFFVLQNTVNYHRGAELLNLCWEEKNRICPFY